MINNAKIYPGLLCDNLEFFKDGDTKKFISGGTVKHISDLPFYYLQLIREKIAQNKDVERELMRMHPDSEMKRVEQFIECNFSGLDYEPDIANNELQQGEYWDCPKRGICPAEGIVCKPLTYNGCAIAHLEVRMMRLLATDMTNEVMAEKLLLPYGTFNKVKARLYDKLGVYTKQEVSIIAMSLNIL